MSARVRNHGEKGECVKRHETPHLTAAGTFRRATDPLHGSGGDRLLPGEN